ncbi:hypothetical protein C8J55DRAFT_502075 [Lentinula edodes]|uniref:Mediator of RNA polymerase II transcription subunit 25 n=1 Tax=Lentinula lateritia TaxID=40482 RepID=A0A9W9AXZ5_9AGAR|nr:hypothetical protein C8J55DRAFT_502075 [Lentinula edodes]
MAVPEPIPRAHTALGSLAIVVDSSVALAGNWHTILKYLGLFVQRLILTNHGAGYRIAWVTYGPPDSLSSPLLCKRFFAEIAEVTNVIKAQDELYQLGVGTTHSGGTRGMAMLEGLVAAVELFDTLGSLSDIPRKSPSHILHITASFPDNAKHPHENMSSLLDEVTWETLPGELSKRNIFLSSIVLNPKNNTKIPEFHSSAALNTAPTSWLPVDPPHKAYVALLNIPQKGVKRPADQMNAIEQPPEKRSNISSGSPPRNNPNPNVNTNPLPTTNSGKPLSSGTPSQPQPKPSNASTQSPAGQPAQPVPPSNLVNLPPPNSTQKIPWPGIGSLTPNELFQRLKYFEDMRRRTDAVLTQAINSGDSSKVEMVKQQTAQWEPMFFKVRNMVSHYITALRRAGMAGPGGAPGQVQASTSTGIGAPANNLNPNPGNADLSSQPLTTQSNPHPNPPSISNVPVASSPTTKPNDSLMPANSSITSATSPGLGAPASSSSTTSSKSPSKPSPKPSAVKPSPKPKPKGSPIKNAASTAPSSIGASSTAGSSASINPVVDGSGPNLTSGIPTPSSLPPEAALQMQKLMEQGGRGHPRDMAMGSMGQVSPNVTAGGVAPQLSPQGMQGMMPGQGQSGQQPQVGGVVGPGGLGAMSSGSVSNTPSTSAGGPNGGIPAWTGGLFYPGEPNGTRRDFRISVMAMSANHLECRAHTWPMEMTLTHTRDPVVSLAEFQMWAKKTRPVVCTIKPHARNPDARQNAFNENYFNGIQALIRQSKTYIVSSWTLPSGAQTNNVLFAIVPPHGFIGAFFPATGIPEMPKPIPGSTMPGGLLGRLPGGVTGESIGAPPAGGAGGGGATGPAPGTNIGPPNILAILQSFRVPPDLTARILQMPPERQIMALKSLAQTKAQLRGQGPGQGGATAAGGQAGTAGMHKSGGSNVNITAAAAAMALRMQSGGIGVPQGGMQGTTGLNMAGIQRQLSGQDGNKPNPQGAANIAALINGMRGNMGGMGGMNAANMGGNIPGMGGSGAGNMFQQQMAQMQQMQQNRSVFGGPGGTGAGVVGGKNLSMDMIQSFMHRNGQEGQGGGQNG